MIAASRLVTIGRTVVPYATWAAYAIQLGYVGYNLYQYYLDYLAQVERDQRSSTQRGIDETIELVVARRRRRLDRQQSDQQQTSIIQEQTNQQQQESVTGVESEQASHPADRVIPTPGNNQHHSDYRSSQDQENSAELAEQIDRDRRSQKHPVVNTIDNHQTVLIDDDDDDASVSLESTDSNRGIIKDMYSECFICARTLNDPNKQVATLPFCMHPFHKTCLDGVLKWHRKCPVCDFDIFSPI